MSKTKKITGITEVKTDDATLAMIVVIINDLLARVRNLESENESLKAQLTYQNDCLGDTSIRVDKIKKAMKTRKKREKFHAHAISWLLDMHPANPFTTSAFVGPCSGGFCPGHEDADDDDESEEDLNETDDTLENDFKPINRKHEECANCRCEKTREYCEDCESSDNEENPDGDDDSPTEDMEVHTIASEEDSLKSENAKRKSSFNVVHKDDIAIKPSKKDTPIEI